MLEQDKKINQLFDYWLYLILVLVFSTIVIGGLTRLTDSGLSITEWELFTGILPPLKDETWIKYFELYQQIPQFKLINSTMNIEEFKIIFYWEYAHRIIARLIGLFFLIPLIYFHFSKKIEKKYLFSCYLVFGLILIQGIVGWYMVKSGLVNNTSVSHYRLSLHLIIALTIISIIFWLIINRMRKTFKKFFCFNKNNLPFLILIFLIFSQIILGAFVSGLDAGKIYQTWPLMGHSFIPNDLEINNISKFFQLDNHSLVQFYHRNMAYFLSIYIILLTFFIYKKEQKITYPILLILFFLLTQIVLGIFTLTSGLNIYLASAHQITSVLLAFTTLNLYFFNIK